MGDRRSTLEMAVLLAWQAQYSVHAGVCSCGRGSIWHGWMLSCAVAAAAFGSCLAGLDVVARAARGLVLRDRRSTLEMAVLTAWQAQYSVHLGLFARQLEHVAGFARAARGLVLRDRRSTLEMAAAFGSCLTGLDVVAREARGLVLRDRRSTLEMAVPSVRGRRSFLCIWVCVRAARGLVFLRGSGARFA